MTTTIDCSRVISAVTEESTKCFTLIGIVYVTRHNIKGSLYDKQSRYTYTHTYSVL